MQNKITHEFELDGVPFKIESGEIGVLSQVSMLVTYGETSVYITVAVGKSDPTLDFFPLTIDYSEKLYAGGIISSSPFIKREGRPTEAEILNGRLIDHAIRSLFDPKFRNETQVIVQVFSYDKVHDALIAGIIGVSFALSYSGLPFLGPYGVTKVGYINGEIVLNPNLEQMKESSLEMFVSSVEKGVVSVEAEAHDIPDEIIKEAIVQAKDHNKKLIAEQLRFVEMYGKKSFEFKVDEDRELSLKTLYEEVLQLYEEPLEKALYLPEKAERLKEIARIESELEEKYKEKIDSKEILVSDLNLTIEKISKKIVRSNILKDAKRLDGRQIDEIRPLTMRTGILPRVHGSAFFTRGETQSLTIVTLGTDRDELMQQGMDGDFSKKYFHHYNMPGYANGEIDRKFGIPNRRAIGHGALGEKALKNVLPSNEDFPYTIRVVSEITSSNGSTSMAATCGSTLALMDAGVQIKKMIGGIGIGLVMENEGNYQILTDIIGMEDFYGDMDFKIAGSKDGITAIQLDNKISGIPVNILLEAIDRSKKGRIFVIEQMEKCMASPRANISSSAPQVKVIKINTDKIGELIGPGGKMIKSITEKTGVEINVEEDGTVKIYSENKEKLEQALAIVNGIVRELEPGMEFDAEIVRTESYGAFIEVPNTKIKGMIHVSNLDMGRVDDVRNVVKIGQRLKVRFTGKDEKGRMKFIVVKDKTNEKHAE